MGPVKASTASLLPRTTKVPAVDSVLDRITVLPWFDPNSIRPHRASGGFNSVVEFGAGFCLRYVADALDVPPFVAWIDGDELAAFVREQEDPFDAEALNQLADRGSGQLYQLAVEYTPHTLEFTAAGRVMLAFRGRMRLLGQGQRPSGDHSALDKHLIIRWPPQGSPVLPQLAGDLQPLGLAQYWQPGIFEAERRLFSPVIATGSLVTIFDFASTELRIEAGLRHTTDAALARVAVHLDAKPQVHLSDSVGDAQRFRERFASGLDQQAADVASRFPLPLVPVVSLCGRNLQNTRVSEVTDFEARVFSVGTKPFQALAIAIDASPGCEGIIERVEQFVGEFDYGVISDESVISRVLRFRWRMGGFHRLMPARQTVRIKRGNEEQDAELRGTALLRTLDEIDARTESNSRQDVIMLGGESTVTTTSLVLRDGTVLGPGDADLGPPQPARWGTYTRPQIAPPAAGDPDLRAFQSRAHSDGYRHVARPFAFCPATSGPTVIYSRLESVTGHLMVLGSIEAIFA